MDDKRLVSLSVLVEIGRYIATTKNITENQLAVQIIQSIKPGPVQSVSHYLVYKINTPDTKIIT